MLLHDLLLHAGRTSGRRPAVIDGARRYDYAELTRRVRGAASGLVTLGLRPGDRVALVGGNTSRYLEAYFALSMAGLVAVPVNVRLSRGEIASQLADADCAAVLAEGTLAADLAAGGRTVLSLGPASGGDWDPLIESAPTGSPERPRGSEEDVAHLFYTGGTTGMAKGVMLTHRNVVASAMNKVVLGGFRRDDVWLHAAPMFHQADAWAVFAFTALGATHVFQPAFDAAAAVALIQRHGVTATQLVPTMVFMMLEAMAPGTRLGDLRRVLYGSAPMPAPLLDRARERFGDVFQHIYGLTETAGTVAATPWPPAPEEIQGERAGSCGQPIPGVRLRIASEGGEALPAGEVGRIQVRSDTVMRGYWNRPQASEAAFVDGWLDTGDLGRLDEDAFLYIVDRARDMIISGGENVYSTEVEAVLYRHPGVAEVAVVGLPHPRWGEAVTAAVVPSPGVEACPQSLIAHCREQLAHYKCPKTVRLVERLPRSATGKVLKHVLRATLAAEVGDDAR